MRIIFTLVTVVAIATVAQNVQAQTQSVGMTVSPISKITLAGVRALSIADGTAGVALTKSDTSTYDIITNDTLHITAAIDAAMPSGSKLSVEMTAPTGATSSGKVELTATAAAVLTHIAPVSQTGIQMIYTFDADVTTAKSLTRTVTYVLVQGA